MVIADVLSDLGYTVLEAGDGRSGLKILEAGTLVDLLITDVGLPGGMNGRQLADAARQRRPDLKVLFITGYAENARCRQRPRGTGYASHDKALRAGRACSQDTRDHRPVITVQDIASWPQGKIVWPHYSRRPNLPLWRFPCSGVQYGRFR